MDRARRFISCLVLIALVVACGGGTATPTLPAASDGPGVNPSASDVAESPDPALYAGKTVRVVVPLGPGGGTDIAARLAADVWADFIPGEPTVVVENVEGAGGALGMQEAARQPPDGLTLVVITAGVKSRWLLGQEGHDYPLDKFIPIGAFGGGATMTVVRDDVATSTEALVDLPSPFVTGHTFPDGTGPLVEKIAAQLLEFPLQQNFGFEGYGEVALAVQRGELQGSTPTDGPYRENFLPLEQEGIGLSVLFQHGILTEGGDIERSPNFADVPTVLEEYTRLKGSDVPDNVEVQTYRALADMNTATFTFLVHPETAPEYVEALRGSFVEMAASPEWKSRSADTFGAEPSVLAGEAAGVSGLGRVPEAVKEYIREASAEG